MATILVTGANRGIGLELCRQLQARGDSVIAACRSAGDELPLIGAQIIEEVEVTDQRGLDALEAGLGNRCLDIVVNAAGILALDALEELDFDSIRAQFEVNALGPLRVTKTVLGRLDRGGKIVVLASIMGSIADNTSGGYYGYRMSKAAASMGARSLAMDLRERGIAVGIFHPGMVATRMTGFSGIEAAQSARNLLARIDELDMQSSGEFIHAEGRPLPW